MSHPLYIFLDEGGNFDFSIKGSRYFSLTSISTVRPFAFNVQLDHYKYDCIEWGLNQEYFHCAEDNSHLRERVFGIIAEHLSTLCIDSILVDKPKTGPALQEPKHFYPKMISYLLKYAIERHQQTTISEIIVITDNIPLNEKRKAVEKAIKMTLSDMLSEDLKYRIIHHASKAHHGLQIADYCNWAIYRKWERGDSQYYDIIKNGIRSEFDIFRSGVRRYY